VKIQKKHNVTLTEVEEFFQNKPKFRRGPKGNHIKENIYYAFGRSNANRLLFVVFVFKKNNEALEDPMQIACYLSSLFLRKTTKH
jgi:uncharacterized DUF497 family protein